MLLVVGAFLYYEPGRMDTSDVGPIRSLSIYLVTGGPLLAIRLKCNNDTVTVVGAGRTGAKPGVGTSFDGSRLLIKGDAQQ